MPATEISFRALSLAKSGRFTCWEEIAATIEGENCPGARRRIGDNADCADAWTFRDSERCGRKRYIETGTRLCRRDSPTARK